jgi:hypothetical protein
MRFINGLWLTSILTAGVRNIRVFLHLWNRCQKLKQCHVSYVMSSGFHLFRTRHKTIASFYRPLFSLAAKCFCLLSLHRKEFPSPPCSNCTPPSRIVMWWNEMLVGWGESLATAAHYSYSVGSGTVVWLLTHILWYASDSNGSAVVICFSQRKH